MNNPNNPDELIDAGRCICGTKIMRGNDNTNELVVVDVWAADAASELLAWAAGRASFVHALARPKGMTLTRRTAQHIKKRPAGFNRDRIVLEHICRLGRTHP